MFTKLIIYNFIIMPSKAVYNLANLFLITERFSSYKVHEIVSFHIITELVCQHSHINGFYV